MNKLNHLAIIMDGNGRWAKQRNLPRINGHKNGLIAMKKIINKSLELNIPSISFFAFSTENWNRPKSEVDYIINLLKDEINNEKFIKWLINNNVKFIWNGFQKNLPNDLINKINFLENKTKHHSKMNLQILFNYGSQQKIVEAVNNLINDHKEITTTSLMSKLDPNNLGPIDLMIRTSGEYRISNFMLFELSYSEFIFNDKYWPDYDENELESDIQKYYNRNRRYGAI